VASYVFSSVYVMSNESQAAIEDYIDALFDHFDGFERNQDNFAPGLKED
jgi:hypothetical protein